MNTGNTMKELPPPGGYDPAAELRIARDIIEGGGGAVDVPAAAEAAAETVLEGPDTAFLPRDVIKGVRFDPERHLTHPNGQPALGSKKQLKLRKEFKKSAGKKVVDAVREKFGYVAEEDAAEEIPVVAEIPIVDEIPVVGEIPDKPPLFDDIPPSDDELEEEFPEGGEIPEPRTPKEERRARKNAEQSANMIITAAGFAVGGEIHRQRKSEEFGDLVDHCEKWNEDTGHSIDLPPNIAFVIAAVGSVVAMAKNEPNCAVRMDNATRAVRQNVLGSLGEKIPFLKVFLGSDAPVQSHDEIPAADKVEAG